MRLGVFFLFSLSFLITNNCEANEITLNNSKSVHSSEILQEFIIENTFLIKTSFVFDTIRLERITQTDNDVFNTLQNDSIVTSHVKFQRGKAILFTVFTGLLGGHRIYLGTHQRTPIIYSVTLGGLGILPLIDLVQIIFTKDLSRFEYRPQIIMWGK